MFLKTCKLWLHCTLVWATGRGKHWYEEKGRAKNECESPHRNFRQTNTIHTQDRVWESIMHAPVTTTWWLASLVSCSDEHIRRKLKGIHCFCSGINCWIRWLLDSFTGRVFKYRPRCSSALLNPWIKAKWTRELNGIGEIKKRQIKNGKCWAGYERNLCCWCSCFACAPDVNEQLWFFSEEMKPRSMTSIWLSTFWSWRAHKQKQKWSIVGGSGRSNKRLCVIGSVLLHLL